MTDLLNDPAFDRYLLCLYDLVYLTGIYIFSLFCKIIIKAITKTGFNTIFFQPIADNGILFF